MLHPDAVFVQDQVLATKVEKHASASLDKIGLKVTCDSVKDPADRGWMHLQNLWDRPNSARPLSNLEHGFSSNDRPFCYSQVGQPVCLRPVSTPHRLSTPRRMDHLNLLRMTNEFSSIFETSMSEDWEPFHFGEQVECC